MSAQAISSGFALGAALIALWLVCRYPGLGPSTLRRGFVLVACAWGLLFLVPPATAAAESAVGAPAALLLVDLPLLMFAFWAAGHVLRLYVATVGRQGL
jgi:hypothetical protein